MIALVRAHTRENEIRRIIKRVKTVTDTIL